jgi:peptide-methionine (S)-S-oxide reductase
MFFHRKPLTIPDPEQALPGRESAMPVPGFHYVNGHRMAPPYPEGLQQAMFGMGCFWGAERRFWQASGVYLTAVGYAAGSTPNPTYEEVCTGGTGHNEVVHMLYDPQLIGYRELLQLFWTGHDPTQGMRQGNDVGTQYRSGIYCYSDGQKEQAGESMQAYGKRLRQNGFGGITTELLEAPVFYYAEEYHQQYLAKNPAGYCGLGGTGVPFD